MKLLSASILSANFSILAKEVKAVERAGIDSIHVDVMDGFFVPNITMGLQGVKAISESTSLPVDVHLMIESPDRYISDFISSGANSITIHQEACKHLHRTIQLINHENNNIQVGVALNPSTPLSQIKWILNEIDFVLLMSVNPGFGGQKFIDNTLHKISELSHMIKDLKLNTYIQVDGGINSKTISQASFAGANIFVAGSAIFEKQSYVEAIVDLKSKF